MLGLFSFEGYLYVFYRPPNYGNEITLELVINKIINRG